MRSRGLLPFFDSAYQGFASGSLDADAKPVRIFVADGGECFAAQSYAKNMGLYGERVGALSIVCKSADVASRVESQLKLVIRPMYSNPPIHGASIVATILKDRNLYNEWTVELKAMADRIITMRQQLFDALRSRGISTCQHCNKNKKAGGACFRGGSRERGSFRGSRGRGGGGGRDFNDGYRRGGRSSRSDNSWSQSSRSSGDDWLIDARRSNRSSSFRSRDSFGGSCFNCGQSGHRASECPTKQGY